MSRTSIDTPPAKEINELRWAQIDDIFTLDTLIKDTKEQQMPRVCFYSGEFLVVTNNFQYRPNRQYLTVMISRMD